MRYSKLADIGNISRVGAQVAGLARWIATVRDMTPKEILTVLENKTVADINFFHGRTSSAVTNQVLFEGDTGGEFTNLTQFIRPTNEFSLITSIRIKSAIAVGAPDVQVWANGVATVDMNGDWTWTVNGTVYRRRYPIFASVPAPEDIDQGVIQLDTPVVIGDQEEQDIRLRWPNATAANFNILFELIGIGTIS